MVTPGIIASTGHSLAPNNPFYLYASMFYFLAYTYYSHYFFFFLRLDLTIARLNWNLLCSPSCPRPHSATRKTFDRWQSSRLGFLTAKSTDGAHLAGCMLSKGSQCACVWIEWGCESWRCRLQGWSSCHAFWWFCRLAFWDGCRVPGSHFSCRSSLLCTSSEGRGSELSLSLHEDTNLSKGTPSSTSADLSKAGPSLPLSGAITENKIFFSVFIFFVI